MRQTRQVCERHETAPFFGSAAAKRLMASLLAAAGNITGGTLLPKQIFPGKTAVTIRIDKIKLKDATSYIEPFFTVTVKGARVVLVTLVLLYRTSIFPRGACV